MNRVTDREERKKNRKPGNTYPVVALLALTFFIFLGAVTIFSPVNGSNINADTAGSSFSGNNNVQNVALLSTSSYFKDRYQGGRGGVDETCLSEGFLTAGCGWYGEDEVESNQIYVYTVNEGDTISQIAEMYEVTPDTVRQVNDVTGENIVPGQRLAILPVSGAMHEVEQGDTLSSIAETYEVESSTILGFNELESGNLLVGMNLIIPGATMPERAPAKPESTPQPAPAPVPQQNTTQYASQGLMAPVVSVQGCRTQGIHGYNAVDIASSIGTAIRAAASGVVEVSSVGRYNGGYGNYIIVAHSNGTKTLYAHNNQNYVSTGQRVSQGETIGTVGSTGFSTGPHVHFEVRGAHNPFSSSTYRGC